ncbi:hypothetical protein Cgig2_007413 [Carnegiea gigantea]|uniref:Thaumatin-like protein 1 n=1 Tax=Carnegiea gigantea TaxID=171969 RepID=A0A9Q1KZI5_9CARY|nr:hypothetical protein Cgig2_007413 [Carnegiea gigantea]
MDLLRLQYTTILLLVAALSSLTVKDVRATTFTFVNKCDYTVWPGILSGANSAPLESTGFELPQGGTRTFQAPAGWSGRFWGRTGCSFDGSGQGSCASGDCGSGRVECGGSGAAPPATLAEFTLNGSGGLDFYDVSLVDGYNLPMIVEASGGSGGQKSSVDSPGSTGAGATMGSGAKTGSSSGPGSRGVVLADGSWLANMATGNYSNTRHPSFGLQFGSLLLLLVITYHLSFQVAVALDQERE